MKILDLTETTYPRVKHLGEHGTIFLNLVFYVEKQDTDLKEYLEVSNREYNMTTVYKTVEDILLSHDEYHKVKKYTGYTFNPLAGWYEKLGDSDEGITKRWMLRYSEGEIWRLREYFTAVPPVEALIYMIKHSPALSEQQFIACLDSLKHWWD